ncbi:MAG: protease pro-enzyme activation domain-containing protein [Steroidobacteraceae bacterium]
MALPQGYTLLNGSEHGHGKGHRILNPTAGSEIVTVTLILRRRPGAPKIVGLEGFSAKSAKPRASLTHEQFAADYGADPKDLDQVSAFARSHQLDVVESNQARRTIVVRGTVTAINQAFGVALHDYDSPLGKYRGHEGGAGVPQELAQVVETVSGLDSRMVPAKHFAAARRHPAGSEDPPNTKPLTPLQVAQLYAFPSGTGGGQTIGIYEMQTSEGSAGYTAQDLTLTMQAFGGDLSVPTPIDVSVDGVENAGASDGETVLDITVSSAIAQAATIAVYFTGGTTQSIIHALQQMIHPGTGDPQPTILSISYGWGPDDESAQSFSDQEYTAIDQLFQDAANLGITVLVSSGDSGAYLGDKEQAQASFPATEPWVTACGGTTIGNVNGATFTEYVWNDSWQGGSGATGGGVSARFPVPSYQANANVPKRNGTGAAGRGIPDISGNASVNSGYPVYVGGQSPGPTGGTSAVAPLFAGLIALINSNLGYSVGFINPILYSLRSSALRDITGPPGPANNSFDGTVGYPATAGWNACTGLGSVNGAAVQKGIQAAHAPS